MERQDSYGAFISYRHTDPDRWWAKWLHARLETYRVPGRLVEAGTPQRVGRVFRDEEELAASADLSQRIDEALEKARFLIVICSPRTPASRWVDEEVKRFQALGREDRVLALLIEGEPEQSFPPALRTLEPLAADVRPVQDESRRTVHKTALLKLLAGVLGVAFDDLRRRDEERKRLRLAWLAGASTMLALVLLGLSFFSWRQWQRAEKELRISKAQNLANLAQLSYVTTPNTDALDTSTIQRGVLLALESLKTWPSVVGDRVLRAGLRKIGSPSLDVVIDPGAELAGVGPQGRWLLLRTDDGLRRFDTTTGHSGVVTEALPEALADGTVLARSRDGQMVVESSEEGAGGPVVAQAVLRRVRDGKTLAVLPHEWFLRFAAFSPDARWLVTVTHQASIDPSDTTATELVGSTVRVWEVSSGDLKTAVSLAREGSMGQVALSPDGGWLATQITAPEGSEVLLWPLWPDLLRGEACRRLTRNLSPSEWTAYVGDGPRRDTCPGLPVVSE